MTTAPKDRPPKPRFIRVPTTTVYALLTAGQRCSNVCYNLAQENKAEPHQARSMKEAFERWDVAVREYVREYHKARK